MLSLSYGRAQRTSSRSEGRRRSRFCRTYKFRNYPRKYKRKQKWTGTPTDDRSPSPTIILLPFGRMVVIDRNVITRLQTDQSGIDFMELSANLIRAHQLRYNSQPSILDSEGTSKGLSPISLGYSPPSYEDIFGDKSGDLPPSYSELSLLFRQRQFPLTEGNELQSFQRIFLRENDGGMAETVLNISEVIDEQPSRVFQEVPRGFEEDQSVFDESQRVFDENQKVFDENHRVFDENHRVFDENHRVFDENQASEDHVVNKQEVDHSSEALSNCKYCVLSLDEGRRVKIKCYCEETSSDQQEAACSSGSCKSDDVDQDIVDTAVSNVVKLENCDGSNVLKESSL